MASSEQQSVYFLYGSQTGNARSIAEELQQAAVAKGFPAICEPLNSFNSLNPPLERARLAVILCSTTGNGDAPENAEKFWRFIKRRTQPKDLFSGLTYVVLGFGDTNYDKFCYMGKNIDKRLSELGGTRFYRSEWVDEATGLEEVVDPWMEGLWPELQQAWFGAGSAATTTDTGANTAAPTESKEEEETKTAEGVPGDVLALPPQMTTIRAHADKIGLDVSKEPEASDLPRSRPQRVVVEPIDTSKEHVQVWDVETRHNGHDWNAETPYPAQIVAAKYLTSGGATADRRVIHMELDLGDSDMSYEPGDSIGIISPNSDFDVRVVLDRLRENHGLQPDAVVFARGTSCAPNQPCTVDELIRYRLDLHSVPRKPLIRALAECCSDPLDRNQLLWLCSKSQKDLYSYVVERQQLSLGELLFMLPSCAPSLQTLLGVCSPMPPRYYSIASSPLVDRRRVAVAFSVVNYAVDPAQHGAEADHGYDASATSGIPRAGLCTNWLERLCAPWLHPDAGAGTAAPQAAPQAAIKVRTFMKPTKDFRLPASMKWPLILIGPGTGVAPFIGFLAHRAAQSKQQEAMLDEVCCGYWRGGYEVELKGEESEIDEFRGREGRGPAWLFFGCRHPEQDWIYKEEMQKYLKDGGLASLQTAFSRLHDKKQYVQDLMLENAEEIARLLTSEGGYVYICGDGNRMAKDVHNSLKSILVMGGNMEEDSAEEYLQEMKQHARYLLDIWS